MNTTSKWNCLFDNVPEKLVIPFAAIKGFFDPSVQFGLQFEMAEEESEEEVTVEDAGGEKSDEKESPHADGTTAIQSAFTNQANSETSASDASNDDSTVVSLDSFRKK